LRRIFGELKVRVVQIVPDEGASKITNNNFYSLPLQGEI
jgi:hypothetical protein